MSDWVRRLVWPIATGAFLIVSLLRIATNHAQASWQWSNFLNQDFWNQNPNNGNIIYSLFGDGTVGATAYTRNRTTSCIPSHIQNVSTIPTTLSANTIYVLSGGTYTLTNNIMIAGNCVALVGRGETYINAGNYTLLSNNKNNVIIDNIKLHDAAYPAHASSFLFSGGTNISLHAVQGYSNSRYGILVDAGASYVTISNSQFYKNGRSGIAVLNGANHVTINNTLSYANDYGIFLGSQFNSINNSQIFNNSAVGVRVEFDENIINESLIYNQSGIGLSVVTSLATGHTYINNVSLYNNITGIHMNTGMLDLFGSVRMFDNVILTGGNGDIIAGTPMLSRTATGTVDTSNPGMEYERVTNPTNGNGDKLLSGTNRSVLRGTQTFSIVSRPLRYLFGLYILRQTQPVTYSGTDVTVYGNATSDFDTNKYIAELDPILSTADMSIVNQYFGSGSIYTQNWDVNGCSLGAFQIKYLTGHFSTGQLLQDHTIYFLTGGVHTFSNNHDKGFIFDGNCIALVGADTTVINRNNTTYAHLLYAIDRRNLILDNLKLDGHFYSGWLSNGRANIGAFFDGASNNTTMNQVQAYNFSQYGISFGISSHHNTIINTQTYNNWEAGIYFYLVSHHNVINNTQTYNNSGYGIRFANGSHRNAMNNFQSYNNAVGVFGDLTTKENIINRAMIYNNSKYGLLLKNSSGNILNDMQLYNNTTGIKTEFGSINNMYQGEFTLFDNVTHMEGTNGSDGNLSAGPDGFFSGGDLTTTGGLMDCSYVTNPNLSGTEVYLLATGANCLTTGWDTSLFSGLNYNIHYRFGPNIYKQIAPISYTSGDVKQKLNAQYDSGKYIAEIFPIRDTTPENISSLGFTGHAEPSTFRTGPAYTVEVINTSVPVTLTGSTGYLSGKILINGFDVGLAGTVNNGDSVQVVLLSATGFTDVVNCSITIGTETTSVHLHTRDPITLPGTGSFNFANITGADLNIYTGSTVTVDSIETGVNASISSGRLVIYSGGNLVSSGATGIVYAGNTVQAMMQSSSQYSTAVTGVVIMGGGSGSFTITTKADVTAPVITFIDNVSLTGYWSDSIDLDFSGADAFSGYAFVSTTGACNSGMSTSLLSGYTGAFTITTHAQNGKYLCAYGKDVGNNITTAISSNTFHVAELRLSDIVETGPVAFDIITPGQTYTSNTKYAFVTTGSQCDNTASMTNYTSSLSIGSTSYNGKYFCLYGEDASGVGKYGVSSNPINIDPSMPTLSFTDEVSSGAVFIDTITVFASTGSSPLVYKFISTVNDCNTSGTINYPAGGVTVSNELSNGKYFCAYATFSGYAIPLVSQYPLNIDRTAPSRPIPTYPTDDENIFFVVLEVTGAIDTGAGLSGYTYEISADDSFSDIVDTDSITTTGYMISPTAFTELTGSFYRKIKAIDKVGLLSARSVTGSFSAIDNEDFFFPSRNNATPDTLYDSDEITIAGLRDHGSALASVDRGSIYKNGIDKGTSTLVQNGDTISVSLRSSPVYDDTVHSTLTVANRSIDFDITTTVDGDSCTLSSGDQTAIQLIYNNLVAQYSGNQNKYDQFLATMRSMLQDRIDLENDCNLKYLSDLINKNIITHVTINTGNYIAPNCKEYGINYDRTKLAFTSPNFRTPVFFANRDALTRYIDSKNPGDCHISTGTTSSWYFGNTDASKHIAPNGKLYTIQSGSNGYTATELQTKKYFIKLTDLRKYLDGKNPPFQVWSHVVDRNVAPVSYTAPNGKVYTIYKTNRGYMSYKLLKIKYYTTLDAIKTFIRNNNMK